MSGPASRGLVRDEGGFTLAEMMVTITIMITVLFALYGIFDMSIRVFEFGNDKVEAVQNARLGMEKMAREIRAAYPVNKVYDPANPSGTKEHIFFAPDAPATPALPAAEAGLAANQRRTITFGNDVGRPPEAGCPPTCPPNRRLYDPATGVPDPNEQITYELNDTCPPNGSASVCTVQRVVNGAPSPLVEYVSPDDPDTATANDGFTFTFLKNNYTAPDAAKNGTDIGVVRIKLVVNKDGRSQKLATDVDLRNR